MKETESRLVVSNPLESHGLYSLWNSPGQNTGMGRVDLPSSPGDLPNPGIKPRSPTLQAESLPAEPQRKPRNPGAGSLSLLQQIFLTHYLNQGLLHCRQILDQLSYQGSPSQKKTSFLSENLEKHTIYNMDKLLKTTCLDRKLRDRQLLYTQELGKDSTIQSDLTSRWHFGVKKVHFNFLEDQPSTRASTW